MRESHQSLCRALSLVICTSFILLLDRTCVVNADGTTTRGLAVQRRDSSVTSRIIGGNTARNGRYPYAQISLATDTGLHQCGGSLIAPDVILTAGHCHGFFTQIRVNIYNIKSELESYEVFEAEQMHFHPQFDELWFRYDFLLLKLNRPVVGLEPVRINEHDDLPDVGDALTVVGWGLMDPDDTTAYPEEMREVDVKYLTNDMCEDTSSKGQSLYSGYIFNDMMCAKGEGKDACSGDSGAPLIRSGNAPEDDVIVAVVSWGNGCATDYPGVYARISYQYEWIKDVVCAISITPPSYFECDADFNADKNESDNSESNNPNSNTNALVQVPVVAEAPVEAEEGVAGALDIPEGYLPIKVEIQLDLRSSETGWALVASDGTVVEEVEAGTYTTPYALVEKIVVLPMSSQLVFVIKDAGGNGICCEFGGGWFQVSVLLTDNSLRPLVKGYGTFAQSSTNVFVTPLENTPLLALEGQGQSQLEGALPCTTSRAGTNSSRAGCSEANREPDNVLLLANINAAQSAATLPTSFFLALVLPTAASLLLVAFFQ